VYFTFPLIVTFLERREEPEKSLNCTLLNAADGTKAKQSKARQSKARQSKAKQSKVKQGKARQDKAKQSKAVFTRVTYSEDLSMTKEMQP
jgi:hypothetical protein